MPLKVSVIKDYNGEEEIMPDPIDPGETAKLISTAEGGIVTVYSIYCAEDDKAGIVYRLEDIDIYREYESDLDLIDKSEIFAEVHFLGRVEVPIHLGRLAVHHFIWQSAN